MQSGKNSEQLTLLDDAPGQAAAAPKRARQEWDLADVRREDLPESLRLVCELVGLEATLALVRILGGVRLSLPRVPAASHPAAHVLGLTAARLLAQHYAGCEIYVPTLAFLRRRRRNRDIRACFDRGERVRELAPRFGLSYRQITDILNSVEH